jgi:hypothetical protein
VVEPIAVGQAPLVSQAAQARRVSGIAREHCAAFAGGDLLVGIKAEDGEIAETAHAAMVEFGADGLAGVFDEGEAMPARNALKRLHVGRNAECVNGQDGARARGNGLFHGRRIEIERDGIDLGKNRRCAYLEHGVSHGYKCERGDNDLIALAYAQRKQRQM